MSFFPPPGPPPEPPPRPRQPDWAGPPHGMLPGISPQRAVVFKTDRALLLVHRFAAYPTGLEFALHVRLRHPAPGRRDLHLDLHAGRPIEGRSERSLRFGLLFGDGSTWTSVDRITDHPWEGGPPAGPTVMSQGGGGGDDSITMRYWLWPLPPEGALTFVAEWPEYDVPESRATVDASELRARAAEAERVWPD